MKSNKNFIIILISILFIFPKNAFCNTNVAYLDMDFIFKNSNFGKKIISDLNESNKINIDKLKKQETELIKIEKELKGQKKLISNDEFNKKLAKLNLKIKEYQKNKEDLIKDFELKKNDEIKIFFNKIDPILKEFLKQNSITLLIDKKNVIVGIESLDITNRIRNLIDEKIK